MIHRKYNIAGIGINVNIDCNDYSPEQEKQMKPFETDVAGEMTMNMAFVEDIEPTGEGSIEFTTEEGQRLAVAIAYPIVRIQAKENGWPVSDQKIDIERKEVDVRLTARYKEANNLIWHFLSYPMDILLPYYNGVHIHSASVVSENKGYMFLGKSGRGKSTHARNWCFSFENTLLLNDDGPIVRLINNEPFVFGSPWSGKTDCYKNESARIGGIVMLHQAKENRIEKASPLRAMAIIAPCIINDIKWDREHHNRVVNIVRRIVEKVAVYDLWCTPAKDSAMLCKSVVAEGNNT